MWWSKALLKKIDKMEVNIKTCYVNFSISHDFNPEGHYTSGLHLKQSLKVTI